jgi:DNA-binding transcriptional MerR regulator
MKNIHILPTDKPSRLIKSQDNDFVYLNTNAPNWFENNLKTTKQNIYITSDEEIKEGDWCIDDEGIVKCTAHAGAMNHYYTKIILTTDQDLIKDGVQAIDDEFLEWFVKNPSCEEVEIFYQDVYSMGKWDRRYSIIIPKEEPKQLFTDHPITELGDKEFVEAPIRECELISYDDNKYCYVKVEGIEKEIKRGYIYTKHGRCGEVDCISIEEIKELLEEEPKQETENLKNFKKLVSDEISPAMKDFIKEKQETIEEAVDRASLLEFPIKEWYRSDDYNREEITAARDGFKRGAKWQAERMYSEEEVLEILREFYKVASLKDFPLVTTIPLWFEQFKKK